MINRVILQGFVAEEPFVRSTERGKVVRIRMATVKYRPNAEGDSHYEIVEWHTVVFWGELANIADTELHAGMAIYTEGELQTRLWEGKNGTKHRTTDIVASQLKILVDGIEGYRLPSSITPFKSEASEQRESREKSENKPKPFSPPMDDIDNLPF